MSRWWKEVRPFVRVERYGNRKGGQARVEVRDEFADSESLLQITGECAVCGVGIAPVRKRQGFAGPYVRVTCGGPICVRSEGARTAYAGLLEYLDTGKMPDNWQERLL